MANAGKLRPTQSLPQPSPAIGEATGHRAGPQPGERFWTVDVFRFDPEQSPRGHIASYCVPKFEKMTVLDALVYIQRHDDRSLAFRYACRLGMCGTCTVMVNGVPRWACRTSIERLGVETIHIAPLRFLPVIKDVLVDFEPFFAKYRAAQPYFVSREEQAEVALISPESRERRAIDPNLECLTCGACYASCTMLAHDAEYLETISITDESCPTSPPNERAGQLQSTPEMDGLVLLPDEPASALGAPGQGAFDRVAVKSLFAPSL